MKKQNLKIKVAAISAAILSAALMQACGSSSGSTVPVAAASSSLCGYNAYDQYTCGTSTTNPTGPELYSACGSATPIPTADAAMGGAVQVVSVTSETAVDQTPVCAIAFIQNVNYQGIRYFLGPNAGSNIYDAGNTGILMEPYDQFAGVASGCYGASGCSNQITDSASTQSTDLYGYAEGMGSYFPFYGQVESVPYDGQGYLYVGVNQGTGEGGSMQLSLQVEVQRCVDSNGNVHQCSSELSPSF